MSESDISALKETLYAQQNLLRKLYNELEAEREASASAANEALSVILRLEGEKAAVRMESEHYKRLSEEKMCHAEESLAIIEDVIYQKEMEVAALDHQVQAYRYKLLSVGCTDRELTFLDKDYLLQRNENSGGETSVQSIGRRNSAPVFWKYMNAINGRESCGVAEADTVSRTVDEKMKLDMCDQAPDSDRKTDYSSPGGISCYWDQIRKLDVRVKEIAGANESPLSRISSGKNKSELHQNDNVAVDSSSSMRIHDVFEVPNVDEELSSRESVERGYVGHLEEVKMDGGDEPYWLKKVLKATCSESKLGQTSCDIRCNMVLVEPSTSKSEYQLNRTSEIIEEVDERLVESSNREEELKLLNEIKEKLDSLHHEIRDMKVKKSSTRYEPSLSVLSEWKSLIAMTSS